MTIEASGYIVHTAEAIYGISPTVVEAVANAQKHVDRETDASALPYSPASAALLALVAEQGGAIAWATVGGVACTLGEEPEWPYRP